jgi:hypothetical protein
VECLHDYLLRHDYLRRRDLILRLMPLLCFHEVSSREINSRSSHKPLSQNQAKRRGLPAGPPNPYEQHLCFQLTELRIQKDTVGRAHDKHRLRVYVHHVSAGSSKNISTCSGKSIGSSNKSVRGSEHQAANHPHPNDDLPINSNKRQASVAATAPVAASISSSNPLQHLLPALNVILSIHIHSSPLPLQHMSSTPTHEF